ncbi:Copper-exporting P-type ATPase A [invertebrate metagenome]|uniref:Copper-exporting P-type ATPase A n=1 Tax=invertebrate metagenome TaxID=1711999 RepID=A0A2H9TAE2_9ZZZZ
MSKLRCYHCHLPVKSASACFMTIQGKKEAFCCEGCRAVATFIMDNELSQFYQLKKNITDKTTQPAKPLKKEHIAQWVVYDRKDMQKTFVSPFKVNGKVQQQAHLFIEGIRCGACLWLIEKRLGQLPGINNCQINLSTHEALIIFNSQQIKPSRIMAEINQLGYQPAPWQAIQQENRLKQENRQFIRQLAVAGMGAMQVMMYAIALYAGAISADMDPILKDLLRHISALIASCVVFYSARPFFSGAWQNIRNLRPGMNLPVALAIGGAYLASLTATFTGQGEIYFDSVSMFTFFLLGGRYLEMRARHKAVRKTLAIEQTLPVTCRLIQKDSLQIIPVQSLNPGDHVRILPGESIPADGIILTGSSYVNESMLTGESLPVKKSTENTVAGGTINTENALDIRITQTGHNMRLSAISRLMGQAQQTKPTIIKIADTIAGYFTSALLVITALVYVYWHWAAPEEAFQITLAVLVITCPCALSLATPTALTTAISCLQKQGILVTKSRLLETLNSINHIVFDKTGTLTQGNLSITRILPIGHCPYSLTQLKHIAASLESHSEHPIAKAFILPTNVKATQVINHMGKGLSGIIEGNPWRIGKPSFVSSTPIAPPTESGLWVLMGFNGQAVCWFALQDQLRSDAQKTIRTLKAQHYRVTLLSGDTEHNVGQIAQQLGIRQWVSETLPKGKLAFIQKRQHRFKDRVLMIGDGLNDAPVLAQADASAAFGNTADLTRTASDSVILSHQLTTIITLLTTARKTQRIIRQNLLWALCYNILALPLAACGLVAPWMAAIGMTTSSLIVMANALRLQEHPIKKTPSQKRDLKKTNLKKNMAT